MARKEYIAARYKRGTTKRLDSLKDYVGGNSRHPVPASDVDRSEVIRELMEFALEVFERRAETWRAEKYAAAR